MLVTFEDEYAATREAVQQALTEETSPWVERGAAELAMHEKSGDVELRPAKAGPCPVTVVVQSDAEVSFFPTAPGTDRSPTIDVYNEHRDRLVDEVRRYTRAFLAGHVEMTLRRGSSAGQVRLWLDDGRVRTHVFNVALKCLVGRGPSWETFRPSPY